MSKVQKHLMDAFAGESQANRKYLAFAERAEADKMPGVAKLFRAVAAAETIHALKHLRTAGEVGTTKENLQKALAGEQFEFRTMYPEMIADAKEEENRRAELTFTYANEVEKVHAALYGKAIENPEQYEVKDYYICNVCGHTVTDEAPDKCPVCGANKKAFFKTE